MYGDKMLYQIGDGLEDYYIFNKKGLSYSVNNSVKSVLENSPLFHGQARIKGIEPNFKDDYILKLDFAHTDDKDLTVDYINKIFLEKLRSPTKVFFYQVDHYGRFKFYYNYVENDKPILIEKKSADDKGLDYRMYSTELRFRYPFLFECDDNLKYVDFSVYDANNLYWSSTAIPGQNNYWGSTTAYWGQAYNETYKKVSTLLDTDKSIIFEDKLPTKPLSLKDRFFLQEDFGLDSINSYGTVLTTNTDILLYLSNDDIKTTAESRTYLIKFNALQKGETIRIANLTNHSDLVITWLDNVANPNSIIFNSHFGEFYDSVNFQTISWNKINYDFTLNDQLYSNSTLTLNPYIRPYSQTILLRKNTATNNTIQIQNLNTYSF